MSKLFWIPFSTGIFHSLAIKNKQEKQWPTTLSILGTSSLYLTSTSYYNEYLLKPEHQKMIPSKLTVPGFLASSFLAASLHTGAFFCLGHLLAKKAYPVFQADL